MIAFQYKTVILVDHTLPIGLAVNASSIVSSMMTTTFPSLMGPAAATSDSILPGVILAPLPVLACTPDTLSTIWKELLEEEHEIELFPFTRLAQSCRTYDEYISKLAQSRISNLELSALGLYGPKKLINSLTGDLPLYRGKGKE